MSAHLDDKIEVGQAELLQIDLHCCKGICGCAWARSACPMVLARTDLGGNEDAAAVCNDTARNCSFHGSADLSLVVVVKCCE